MSYFLYCSKSKQKLIIKQFLSIFFGLLIFFGIFSLPSLVKAQVAAPNREFIFIEDEAKPKIEKARRKAIRDKRKKAQENAQKVEGIPFDINAKSITFDSANNSVKAEGGVLLGHPSGIIEAESAEFNIESNEAIIKDNVRVTEVTTTMSADEAWLNVKSGEARLSNAEIKMEDGDYLLNATEISKSEEEDYSLKHAQLTTCHCPEGKEVCPWKLRAEDAEITRNGYGEIWNGSLLVNDVPVMYIPYLIFPAKTERQTGFLPATLGGSNRSAFTMQAPLYIVVDDSSDVTLTPWLETGVRVGSDSEIRKIFSSQHRLKLGTLYLNESWRDGDLLGTNVDGLADPSIRTNRVQSYYKQNYQNTWGGGQVAQFVADGRYVSDDLLLREIENDNIGAYNARFVTSKASLRTTILDRYSAELSSEYNQAMVDNDDYIFQRLPSATLKGTNVFRPFGENALGAKLVLLSSLNTTQFTRTTGYDGNRSEFYEKLSLPFHVMNYFDSEISADVRGSSYSLSDEEIVNKSTGEITGELPGTSDRLVPGFNYTTSTVLENVYPVTQDGIFRKMFNLGYKSRSEELTRVKHTIEPTIKYRYVPSVDQSDNPQFDSYDHLEQKNLITYGVTQRLYARYEPLNEYLYGIEEITPKPENLTGIRSNMPLDQQYGFGYSSAENNGEYSMRRGSVAEVARLKLYQSFDVLNEINKDKEDPQYDLSSFSDLGVDALLIPNEHLAIRTRNNFDIERAMFSSYSVEGQLVDKRGDELRSRLNFIEAQVRQLESSVLLRLLEDVKIGYYSRYDDETGTFIEQKAGLRFTSDCNCWIFDVGVIDKLNPDETRFMFNVTLLGLGEFGNTFMSPYQDKNNNQ